MMTVHPLSPVYSSSSRVLILGSFPSVISRERGFYYAHPRNRFWPLISFLCGKESVPVLTKEKIGLLLDNGIALWDVIAECEITGSMDSNIRSPRPNQIGKILEAAPIGPIFCNGTAAFTLYKRLILPETGREAVLLPSTSPANASFSMEKLKSVWGGALLPYLAKEGSVCR